MSAGFKSFLQRWVINTLAVLVAASILSNRIHYDTWTDLVLASLLLGVLNAFVRPVIQLLSISLIIFTLGLFTLVINALMLLLVSALMRPKFAILGEDSSTMFWNAFWGALIISLVSIVLNSLTGTGNSRVKFTRGKSDKKKDDGNGPVIDV